jgi:RecA/RadA recombinase
MVTFTGNFVTGIRLPLGLLSFDLAVGGKFEKGQFGLTTRQGVLINGLTGVGKTTVAASLAARIAQQLDTNIAYAAVDTFNPSMFRDIIEYNGFTGEIDLVGEDTDEETIDALKFRYAKPEYGVAVLDSIWSVQPIAEAEGQSGDRNVAARANAIGPWANKMHHVTTNPANPDKIWFATNHILQNIGGRFVGNYKPGGRKVSGVTSIHMDLSQAYVKNKAVRYPQGRLLMGKITKNNFGREDIVFQLFVLGGYGIHTGLTAMYDCVEFGYAKIERSVSLNGEKLRAMKFYLENWEDEELFAPFIQCLEDNKQDIIDGLMGKKPSKKKEEVTEEEETIDGLTADELYEG